MHRRSAAMALCLTIFLGGPLWYLAQDQQVAATGMIQIPAGPFPMGNDAGPADERPRHQVYLNAFLIDRTPVTNAQFTAFLNAMGLINAHGERLFDAEDHDARIHQQGKTWVADPGFAAHPVVEISWVGARDYCHWLGKQLPTEAESITAS